MTTSPTSPPAIPATPCGCPKAPATCTHRSPTGPHAAAGFGADAEARALFTHAPGFSAEIGGHTDNVGTPEHNLKLSDARAASVKSWLQAHGIAPARVASRGYGDTRTLLPNTTDENRFKNRRVELRTANCR
jgi:hypothetical protein